MKRVLFWREQGDKEWIEWDDKIASMELNEYTLDKIYKYEYKVIEIED